MNIDELLKAAMQWGASDVHLAVPATPMFRMQHQIVPAGEEPLTPGAMWEIFEVMTTDRQRAIFNKDLELDFAYSISGMGRFRVNASMQRGSVALTIRCLPVRIPTIEELGLPELCKTLVMKKKGLILVTGSTSSGKSTTQAAMIGYLNERESRKVLTIEDPVEYLHANKKCLIVQRELDSDTPSFASAMKHALRQNSDVILVGEMRDMATIATAITAAETGHLVLATAHTQGAANVISRLISEFPSVQQEQLRTQLALTIEAVLTQVLLPRVDGKGRVAVFEIMLASYAIRNLIRENKCHQITSMIETSSQLGMQTLDQALEEVVKKGLVKLEDAMLRSQRPDDLEKSCNGQRARAEGTESVGKTR